jgi:tetratricopeptide (TPR) repeat protein
MARFVLDSTGRQDKANESCSELDPFSASIIHAVAQLLGPPVDEASRVPGGGRTSSNYWTAHYFLGLSYAHGGNLPPAITALREAEAIGDSLWRYSGLGFAYGLAGQPAKAHELLAKLDRLSEQQYVPAHVRAPICLGLGDKDQAFAWLERAVEERDWQMAWLAVDPFWDSVRSDSRLSRLIAKTGLGGRASGSTQPGQSA